MDKYGTLNYGYIFLKDMTVFKTCFNVNGDINFMGKKGRQDLWARKTMWYTSHEVSLNS